MLSVLHELVVITTVKQVMVSENREEKKRKMGRKNSVVSNVLDCDIIVGEFEFQSGYIFHFWNYTLGEDMGSLIYPATG